LLQFVVDSGFVEFDLCSVRHNDTIRRSAEQGTATFFQA